MSNTSIDLPLGCGLFWDGSLVCDEKRSYLWAICAYNNEFQD
jgi:hypothetical protein